MVRKASLFLFLLMLLGQMAPAQLVWEKAWGGTFEDPCEVRNTREGDLIVMASYAVNSYLMRFTPNGDTIWTRRIQEPLDFCSVTQCPDGGFLCAGTTRYANRDIILRKYSPNGDSLWSVIYPDSNHTQGLYTIQSLPGHQFLVTGYTNANAYDMLAMKIDSMGGLAWRKTYGSSSFEAGAMPSLMPDGGFAFATTASPSQLSHFWLVRTDSMGDTIWTRHYPKPLETGGAIPLALDDGRIFVLGWIAEGNNYDNYLSLVDSNGNELWNKRYPGIGFENRTAKGMIADRWGGFSFLAVVDAGFAPGTDRDMALFRLDSSGNVQKIHRLGYAQDEMPRYFEQAANGDYILLGYSQSISPNNQLNYMARLRPDSCGTFFYYLNHATRDSLCPGDTLWLDAGQGYSSFQWNDGFSQQIRPVTVGDTFSVIATDAQGCLNYSNTVLIESLLPPAFSWTDLGGGMIQFDGQLGSSSSNLSWDFGDGGNSQLEDPLHSYPQPGSYWVCLSQFIPDCGIEQVCDSILVSNTSNIQPALPDLVQIQPQPANENCQIFQHTGWPMQMQLFNTSGQLLGKFEIPDNSPTDLPTFALPNGMYWLVFTDSKACVATKKLIVLH